MQPDQGPHMTMYMSEYCCSCNACSWLVVLSAQGETFSGTPAPLSRDASPAQVAQAVQQLLDVFVDKGFCIKVGDRGGNSICCLCFLLPHVRRCRWCLIVHAHAQYVCAKGLLAKQPAWQAEVAQGVS